ncbi:hypothetical protein MARPO_0081s0042 [Marchantia polymorpha]|uniref:Uncharacterized protein n=1 Tax=Marchantia polymorpha TaxID=3197 RepID=A0A2R6WKC9_MARPO|nr:hypothetical protein MARPO_0081s0042 [Marchantia polymorpha]|eukprot:PTQ34315.1 hypothetical protein MARPO_0081s0042 [Marchantia polymorpha]
MIIGRMLGVQPKSFSFAGTKDKRAVTTQQVTVYKQPAAKLALLNKKLMGVNLVTSAMRKSQSEAMSFLNERRLVLIWKIQHSYDDFLPST